MSKSVVVLAQGQCGSCGHRIDGVPVPQAATQDGADVRCARCERITVLGEFRPPRGGVDA